MSTQNKGDSRIRTGGGGFADLRRMSCNLLFTGISGGILKCLPKFRPVSGCSSVFREGRIEGVLRLRIMTAHTQPLPASVPATVEAKAFYFSSLLYDLHKGDRFLLTNDSPMIAPVTMRFGDAADGTVRCIYSISYSIDPIYVTSTAPLWGNTLQFANATIPARYL